ncbi:hypothetical protein C7E12_22880, partial [Stenotrophomonas maltophilia]
RRNYERFGFLPVETPVFELSDVLLTKSGGRDRAPGVLRAVRRNYERFGFLPVETPVFELSDVLLTKSGGRDR